MADRVGRAYPAAALGSFPRLTSGATCGTVAGMNTDPLDRIAEQLAARKAALDAEFAPKVRNHLVQLFRKAHAVEPKLTGLIAAQGTACARGEYSMTEDGETWTKRAHEWSATQITQPAPAVRAFLSAVAAYSDRICAGRADDLPYIADITPADLEPNTAKRAAVWRARQARA